MAVKAIESIGHKRLLTVNNEQKQLLRVKRVEARQFIALTKSP